MIIVEGADGTGKTTLCQELSKQLNLEYVKLPRHKTDPETNGLKFYMQHAELVPDMAVIDRFHIGECVYPLLYPDDPRRPLKLWQQHAIERCLQIRGCLLIHVSADTSFVTQNLAQRGEGFVWSEVKREQDLFAEKCCQSLLLRKTYIPTHTNLEHFCENIKSLHHKILSQTLPFQQYQGTGSLHYPVMVVGEGINQKYDTNHAFHAWAGSSAYLHEALEIAGANSAYLTNADKTRDDNKNVSLIMLENYHLSPVNILTLGKVADSLLTRCHLKHVAIAHPAYHQRFHHDVYAYAELIKQVIV
jgi:hypothetical protein